MDPLTAVAVGSAVVSAYGQWKAASAQADAARQQAQLNNLRADEILARNEINNSLIQESALSFTGTQLTQFAGSGRSGETASDRKAIYDTMKTAARQIELNNRAAEWEARMTRLGAQSQMKSADQLETAGQISTIGNLGFNLFSTYKSTPASTSKLPNYSKES